MTRPQIHQAFVSKFHAGERPVVFNDSEIQDIERNLTIVLPESYLHFMRTHGPIYTPSLLSLIVESELTQWDLQEFLKAREVIENTRMYWSGGMSDSFVCFASDSMGNMFCFRRNQAGGKRPDDAPVWFFDHEFCDDIDQLAESFDGWLFSYLKLTKKDLMK